MRVRRPRWPARAIVLFAILAGGAGMVRAQVTTWSGTGDWSSAANWSAGVPISTSNVVISTGTVTVSDTRAVNALTLSGGTLNGTGTLNVGGLLTVGGGTSLSGGGMVDLGLFGGAYGPSAINAAGQIVGAAAYYTGGTTYDLNSLVTGASGFSVSTATGINDLGQIVGIGSLGESNIAFLLTPSAIPEPSTYAALAGLGVAVIRRRGRPDIIRTRTAGPFRGNQPCHPTSTP